MAVFTRIILVACLAVCVSGAFKIRDDANGVPRSASEGDVIRDLLARHVKYGIPQPVGSLQVKLGLYVEAVTEVDVEKGTVEVVGFLSLQWEDPRLRFEHSDPFHEVKDVRLPASEVWRPDIELYTQVTPGMQIMNTARDQVLVEYNGTVKWFPMVGLRTLCADLSFDKTEVHCALKFGSWTYQKHAMELAVNHPMGVLSQYRSTGQWTVSEATAERVEAKYECCPDTYVFVAYNLTLQKQDL
ncbi:acetylcholine receptor subunit alpha-type acr-16-like isoform X1 [Littorina saxatilis]|uniref:acetylcholine receptor subunit alpha-type acr-16-like isoform X1 n=1 Tax=Littorina saxatilis TaxID=31220 RepID=UPI0038B462F1